MIYPELPESTRRLLLEIVNDVNSKITIPAETQEALMKHSTDALEQFNRSIDSRTQEALMKHSTDALEQFNQSIDSRTQEYIANTFNQPNFKTFITQLDLAEDFWTKAYIDDESIKLAAKVLEQTNRSVSEQIESFLPDILKIEDLLPKIDFSEFFVDVAKHYQTSSTPAPDDTEDENLQEVIDRIETADEQELQDINTEARELASQLLQSMEFRAKILLSLNNALTMALTAATERPCKFLSGENNRGLIVGLATAPFINMSSSLIGVAMTSLISPVIIWIMTWAVDRIRQENCPE